MPLNMTLNNTLYTWTYVSAMFYIKVNNLQSFFLHVFSGQKNCSFDFVATKFQALFFGKCVFVNNWVNFYFLSF